MTAIPGPLEHLTAFAIVLVVGLLVGLLFGLGFGWQWRSRRHRC
jgi:hypothetical protein